MFHKRRRPTFLPTKGKVSVKHGTTLVDNNGAGVGSFFVQDILKTVVGDRNISGAGQAVQTQQHTDNRCMIGSIVKYLNICIECSPRGVEPTNVLDNAGWLEWGVVWQQEETDDLNVSNIGLENLGVLLGRFYRNNAIMSGCFPVGTRQAMSTDIKIKVPKRMQAIKIGSLFKIFCYFRSSSSTDVRTDSHRFVVSSQYKTYG